MLILSQFNDLYYYFDDQNIYHRGKLYIFSFLVPILSLLIQLSVVVQYIKRLSPGLSFSIFLFILMPVFSSVFQVFVYGVSLLNMGIAVTTLVIYVFALGDMRRSYNELNRKEIERFKEERERMRLMFEQTAEALASAIDAKDAYTRGHSARVAEYSEKIARLAGMSEEKCDEIYYAGLLHDVGKIGIADSIINKNGRLDDAEYAEIKKHPVIGKQILSSISESPYLSIGAHYHHERYDGKGYPQGLKGNDIPEMARIIAVADAYDAMTSKRSYRKPIPQQMVREELVKGMGTQFDPKYARIMLHLLDMDEEYEMQERDEIKELSGKNELVVGAYGSNISEGILINAETTRISLRYEAAKGYASADSIPSFIVFDSMDARAHERDGKASEMGYSVYGQIRPDGRVKDGDIRKSRVTREKSRLAEDDRDVNKGVYAIEMEAVRFGDHMRVITDNGKERIVTIFAMPDSSRYSYIGITGENCRIFDVRIDKDDTATGEEAIERIAPKISYIDVPEGDIPNVQIDGWRSASTEGIDTEKKTEITFHSMSLPTARLLWHCPFVILFYSEDGKVNGPGFTEFALMRTDGEGWEMHEGVESKISVSKEDDFEGWDVWKEKQKKGVECTVTIEKKHNSYTVVTRNEGIVLKDVTRIELDVPRVYAALSGDQCALTGIKIKKYRS